MSLLERLSQPAVWESFYEYKTSLALPRRDAERLRRFIDEKGYLPVCESIRAGGRFPLPEKSVISKLSSQKKRVVYTYPEAENRVLKLLTYLMLRKYDGAFPSGLYSFRPGRTAKDALTGLLRLPVQRMYSYKADVSNYFNSIEIPRLLPMLRETLEDDPELYRFLAALLSEPEALENGLPVVEQKGIMAGTPIASFFANLFLADLDRHFERAGVPYRRYSDDIILFGSTPEETAQHAAFVRDFLAENGLFLNPAAEQGIIRRVDYGVHAHKRYIVSFDYKRHCISPFVLVLLIIPTQRGFVNSAGGYLSRALILSSSVSTSASLISSS